MTKSWGWINQPIYCKSDNPNCIKIGLKESAIGQSLRIRPYKASQNTKYLWQIANRITNISELEDEINTSLQNMRDLFFLYKMHFMCFQYGRWGGGHGAANTRTQHKTWYPKLSNALRGRFTTLTEKLTVHNFMFSLQCILLSVTYKKKEKKKREC